MPMDAGVPELLEFTRSHTAEVRVEALVPGTAAMLSDLRTTGAARLHA